MKRALAVGMLLLLTLLVIPQASAVANPVEGLRASVTAVGASTFIVELRMQVSSDDPDQDTGSYTYNVTLDAGSGWVNLGNTTSRNNFQASDSYQTWTHTFTGASFTGTFNVTADDGTGPTDGCTVTVNVGTLYAYDSCGSMTPTYSQIYCLPRTGNTTTGWNYENGVSISDPLLAYQRPTGQGIASSGLNLPGETTSYQWNYSITADSDSTASHFTIFFSEVPSESSALTRPSAPDINDRPTTNAYTDGVGVFYVEDGSTWDITLFLNSGGLSQTLATETWSLDPNTFGFDGYIHIDPASQTVSAGLDTESLTASLIYASSAPENFHMTWMSEHGGVSPLRATTFMDRDQGSANLCLSSTEASSGITGGPTGLEDFTGNGGFGGAPQFPGLNVTQWSNDLNIDTRNLGYLLAGMLVFVAAGTGYQWAGRSGGLLITGASFPLLAILNLIPFWHLVVMIIAASTIIFILPRGGTT